LTSLTADMFMRVLEMLGMYWGFEELVNNFNYSEFWWLTRICFQVCISYSSFLLSIISYIWWYSVFD